MAEFIELANLGLGTIEEEGALEESTSFNSRSFSIIKCSCFIFW